LENVLKEIQSCLENVMGESRIWSVESKEFEMMIKGGNSGVRIVERSNKKQRSVFIQRDEVAWLVGSVEALMNVGTFEVFWDQSRAGYQRIIVQKCANRHGHFLTIEEFDGRRRCGNILIPEGRRGQGRERLISELKKASSSLWEGRVFRESKMKKVATDGRSFAEVVGLSKISSGLKEITAAVGEPSPASQCVGNERSLPKAHSQTGPVRVSVEAGGCSRPVGGATGEKDWSTVGKQPVKGTVGVGVACSVLQQGVKGHMENTINAKLELGYCREWLRRLRGEVDAGLLRLDAVIKELEISGPGQGNKGMGWASKPTAERDSKPKDNQEPKGKKAVTRLGMGMGLGPEGQAHSSFAGSSLLPQNKARGSEEIHAASSDGTGDPDEDISAAKGLPGESGSLPGDLGGKEGEACSRNLPTVEVTPVGNTCIPSGCAQTLPVGVNVGRDMTGETPARRDEVSYGEKGLLARPICSWVAGRTGFGPVDTGKVTGVPKSAEIPTGHSDLVVLPQSEVQAALGGLGASDQGTDTEKILGAIEEFIGSEDGLETSYVEETAEVTGDVEGTQNGASPVTILKRKGGVVIEELADSPVTKNLKMALVVGGVTGLSGPEELKVGCLKKIIVDKHGQRGGSNCEGSQQEVESLVQVRGNCSDYEA
jgi:hypothetical protein